MEGLLLGALVAIVSALMFSLSDVAVRRGVVRAPVSHAAFVTVLLGVPLFAIATLVTGQFLNLGDLSTESYALLSGAGLIHYVGGRYFNYAAIGAIGAARSSPVQALSLPYSVLIALLFLDEGVTAGMAVGIGLIFVGPLLMVERQPAPVVAAAAAPTAAPTTIPPVTPESPASEAIPFRQAEGYVYATLSALCYGSSPVLIRAALDGESGVSILGGLVSYVAAAALLIASLAIPSRRVLLSTLHPASVRVFFAAGFFVFMAQVLRFVALSMASVAVVATLLRFGSLFTLALSMTINRRLEHITRRTIAGIIISVAGAVLLVATRDG